MYSTCLFCHAGLGHNELIASFPVGRRLAFDSAKGRLWVVCRTCGRWNLTPLESRWEAVEDCERRFRGTRLRVSTDNIGLAEFPGGASLVRIGNPLRPEMAAWRYGRTFGRRRLRAGAAVGVGVAGATALALGGVALGAGVMGLYVAYSVGLLAVKGRPDHVVAKVPHDGRVLRVQREDLSRIRVFPDETRGGFGLVLHHSEGVEFFGNTKARHALGKVFPAINRFGADRSALESAVEILDHVGDSDAYVEFMFRRASSRVIDSLTDFPEAASLALEIALHEDTERRALEGELAELERAWREAEEIAAIADELFLPERVYRRLGELRQRISETQQS